MALEARLKANIHKFSKAKVTTKPSRTPKETKPKALESRPTDADKYKPIFWKKKPWYWCDESTGGKCDGKWRCHKPSECLGKNFKPKGKGNHKTIQPDTKGNKRGQGKSVNNQNKREPKKLKLVKAMQAISGEQVSDGENSTE